MKALMIIAALAGAEVCAKADVVATTPARAAMIMRAFM